MARTRKNATRDKLYKGWTLEISGRGAGCWDVIAGKGHRWYAVGLFEGPVSEAFQLGKDWVDERSTMSGRFRRAFVDEQLPEWRRRHRNPCVGLHLHNKDLVPFLNELSREGVAKNPCIGLHVHSEDLVPLIKELGDQGRLHLQANPIIVRGDRVRLPNGEEGYAESAIRGHVYVRTDGGQLRGAHESDLVVLEAGPGRAPFRVPTLKRWKKDKDDCDQWTYAVGVDDGIFMIWQPSADPVYDCDTDGSWRAAFIPDKGVGGLVSGDLERAQDGVIWARAQGITAQANPRRNDLKRKLMGNPARREFIDDLTGTRVSSLIAGGRGTGDMVVRTRPAPGEPFQVVEVESDTMDHRRDTFGLEPSSTKFYREQAAKKAKADAKARRAPPLPRDADLELGRLGLRTAFGSPEEALNEFENLNLAFFDNPLLHDLDASPITSEFMERLEVARGPRGKKRKHVSLRKTTRGKEILAEPGGTQVREMLKYLFGTAKGRRWKTVPWHVVDEYIEQIGDLMQDEGQRQRVAGGMTRAANYPLASGQIEGAEFLARVSEEVGPAKAQKLADLRNSQELWSAVGRLERILKPPKGPAGKEGRADLKCIPKEDRKILRHRVRVLTEWAKWPNLVPDWACVPDEGQQAAEVCTYPAIWEDVGRIENACHEPYQVNWPAASRGELWGIYPLEEEEPVPWQQGEEDLDLPWETASNPRRAALKRRLMR